MPVFVRFWSFLTVFWYLIFSYKEKIVRFVRRCFGRLDGSIRALRKVRFRNETRKVFPNPGVISSNSTLRFCVARKSSMQLRIRHTYRNRQPKKITHPPHPRNSQLLSSTVQKFLIPQLHTQAQNSWSLSSKSEDRVLRSSVWLVQDLIRDHDVLQLLDLGLALLVCAGDDILDANQANDLCVGGVYNELNKGEINFK